MIEELKTLLSTFNIESDISCEGNIGEYYIKITRISDEAWCNDFDNPYIKILSTVEQLEQNMRTSSLVQISCNIPVHIYQTYQDHGRTVTDSKKYLILISLELIQDKKNYEEKNEENLKEKNEEKREEDEEKSTQTSLGGSTVDSNVVELESINQNQKPRKTNRRSKNEQE